MDISTNLYRPASQHRLQIPNTHLSSALKLHQKPIISNYDPQQTKSKIPNSHTIDVNKTKSYYDKLTSKKENKMDKLLRIDQIKASNIDELNLKIKNMVNKLTIEECPTYSFAKEKLPKERFKTDYTHSEYESNQSLRFHKFFQQGFDKNQGGYRLQAQSNLAVSKIIDPIFSSLDREKFKEKSAKKYQLQRIRSKYKNVNKQMANSSTFNNSKAQLFQSKLKASTKTEYHNLSTDSNLTASFASDKQNNTIQSSHLSKKADISQDIKAYQRKVEGYNNRKQALLNQCRKQPLQDTTNNYCNKTESNNNQKKEYNFKKVDIIDNDHKEDLQSDPPTADFRMNQPENQLKILLSSFIDQIKLDEKFRNAKKWFSRQNSKGKWRDLEQILSKNGIFLDEESIRQIFSLQEEEQNPFYSSKDKDFEIKTVAEQFIKCEQNWFLNLVKKFDRSNLEMAGFRNRNIDTSQKGYLNIEDLVRFLNIEMDMHYRTRDIYLIYLRLKNEHRLTYQDIIEVICY